MEASKILREGSKANNRITALALTRTVWFPEGSSWKSSWDGETSGPRMVTSVCKHDRKFVWVNSPVAQD